MAELVTPVAYAKLAGIPPQQVYGLMKRGLPTKQAEHKGKVRDMVDPDEANKWRELYNTTKRTRRTKDEIEDSDSPRENEPYQPLFKGGEIVMHSRGKKNVSISRIKRPDDEHFAYLERNMYNFPFLLNPTYEEDWFLDSPTLKRKILNREIIIDTPFQAMEYCLAQIEVARPELTEEIRAVIQKHVRDTKEIVDSAEKTCYNYHRS